MGHDKCLAFGTGNADGAGSDALRSARGLPAPTGTPWRCASSANHCPYSCRACTSICCSSVARASNPRPHASMLLRIVLSSGSMRKTARTHVPQPRVLVVAHGAAEAAGQRGRHRLVVGVVAIARRAGRGRADSDGPPMDYKASNPTRRCGRSWLLSHWQQPLGQVS